MGSLVPEPTPPAGASSSEAPRRAPRGEQLNADELGAWRGLLRVHARVIQVLDAELAASHALSLISYDVLLQLDNAGRGLRMAELVDSVLLDRSGHTGLVERLEQRGLAHGDATDLADSVLLSRAGLARLVERLEQRGLVRRESPPAADRGFEFVLTDSGRTTLLEARKTHLSGVRRLFLELLSVKEQRTMGGYFDRILEALEE
jgi:DNA-binding MarR family transcriptional regulator